MPFNLFYRKEFCGIDGHRLYESDEDPLIGLELTGTKLFRAQQYGICLSRGTYCFESKRAYKTAF